MPQCCLTNDVKGNLVHFRRRLGEEEPKVLLDLLQLYIGKILPDCDPLVLISDFKKLIRLFIPVTLSARV